MNLQRLIFFLLVTALLTGCTAPERPPYTRELQITIRETGLSAPRWYIPAEKTIQIELTNLTDAVHTWSIMDLPDSGTPGVAWFSEQILPGETRSINFTAPTAPGEYDVVSESQADSNEKFNAEFVVVQP
jgi:hypothetical protein